MSKDDESSFRDWKDLRQTAVTSSQGNLALVQTTWFTGDETYDESELLDNQPSTVVVTELIRKNFNGDIVAKGFRLWDSQSSSILNFSHIDTFDYDPGWALIGRFNRCTSDTPITFELVRGNGETRDLSVPGEVHLTIGEEDYKFHAFDDGGKLLLVFGDLTNGKETYGPGRFLFIETTPGSDEIIVDFNRSFLPPCAFSHQFNCPIPPPQNRVNVPIFAGEKNPLFNNDYQLH